MEEAVPTYDDKYVRHRFGSLDPARISLYGLNHIQDISCNMRNRSISLRGIREFRNVVNLVVVGALVYIDTVDGELYIGYRDGASLYGLITEVNVESSTDGMSRMNAVARVVGGNVTNHANICRSRSGVDIFHIHAAYHESSADRFLNEVRNRTT